jgi:serine/threonine protein kinase
VKIGDFGIGKILQDSLDKASTAIGTPYYLSPAICHRHLYPFQFYLNLKKTDGKITCPKLEIAYPKKSTLQNYGTHFAETDAENDTSTSSF